MLWGILRPCGGEGPVDNTSENSYGSHNCKTTPVVLNKNNTESKESYGAHNYRTIPVTLNRGEGIYVWDVENKKYFDFHSAYSTINQGHCHPKILEALKSQAEKLMLTSRAFHNDTFEEYEKFVTNFFNYQQMYPMNTGAEGVETALKLCRQWAYRKKGIPKNQAKIIFMEGNFHGRTLAVVSGSTYSFVRDGFGPFLPGIEIIPYNNINAVEEALQDPNVAGILLEPIQGEAGVVVPDDGYLRKTFQLCEEKNVLFIADEVQTGLGRTGRKLACDHEDVRPHILILGKALSGGAFPVSLVLADEDIMSCLRPGEHGSTYGGNPLACSTTMAALQILEEENLAENSSTLGAIFRKEMSTMKYPWIKEVRGKGLFNVIEFYSQEEKKISAWDISAKLEKNGLLAKPIHETIIRFAPPLVITEAQILRACKIIQETFAEYNRNI